MVVVVIGFKAFGGFVNVGACHRCEGADVVFVRHITLPASATEDDVRTDECSAQRERSR